MRTSEKAGYFELARFRRQHGGSSANSERENPNKSSALSRGYLLVDAVTRSFARGIIWLLKSKRR
jgi:hypothetical protein